MKKLILVFVGLVVVLLLSMWAKGANFNIITMVQPLKQVTATSNTTEKGPIQPTTPPIITEILITVTPNGFVPDAITIQPGTKITWVNKSGAKANVSSHALLGHDDFPALNLNDFDTNNSVSLTFTTIGRYGYYNKLRPSATGVIIVQK